MVEYNTEQIDNIFHALADPTRRNILFRLARREQSVNEIAEPYEISLAAVSKHLKVLERADLIVRRKEGRSFKCRMNYRPLEEAADLIGKYRAFWEERLDNLEQFLDESKKKKGD
ncbi:MAG: metalloregulator ArsR/SmtB family transcription factor [Balneolaceae bacterium]|nr:metalloregulator ArsR/SmtB family transcription factor [Balneolaceae bacterium]